MEIFTYDFVLRALTVGLLVSVCAALLGVSLVLKKYSMIGDGLSHVGFGALACAAAANIAPLPVAVVVVIIAAFLLMMLSERGKIKGDAAIALISAGALAVGVVIVSLSGTNIDLNSYMFGSVLSLSSGDVLMSVILCTAVLFLYVFMFARIFAVTFDENFARATGVHTRACNTLLAVLTAVTVVMGMRLMGALLISSLIIFPSISSMHIFSSYKKVVILSVLLSVFCFISGFLMSYYLETPTGATVVCVNVALFFICFVIDKIKYLFFKSKKKTQEG
ncbi:MAG: ABC transporter [Clostridiales bacterium]|nr:MAG: ABC transporter [Clostridiales bacterium]